MSVTCECWLLSGRGIWVGLITHSEESYLLWCVTEWSRSLVKGGPGPIGAVAPRKESLIHLCQGMAAFTPIPTFTPTHKIIKTTSIAINTNFNVFKHILLIVSFAVPDHIVHTAYL
jgi:hypothetical protein